MDLSLEKQNLKLKRKVKVLEYQNLEIEKLKKELNNIQSSRIWILREILFSNHMRLSDRLTSLISIIPVISSVYKKCENMLLSLTSVTVINSKELNPLISVIIPFYNYYDYIDDCINSVLRQGLGNRVEIIVIEGFSTDGSREKIRAKKWENTRVIYQDHRTSIGENRLLGIQESKGRYICMLDADDMLAPDYFKKGIELLEKGFYDVIYPDIKYFEEEDGEKVMPEFSFDNIFEFNFIPIPSIFRTSFWKEKNIEYSLSKEIFEDWDFWMRMAKSGARFAHLNGFYHLYRIHTTTVPSMTDIRLKEQVNKDTMTRKSYRDFIHSREYYKARRLQKKIIKVINPDINIEW